jgi:hypothetical protein
VAQHAEHSTSRLPISPRQQREVKEVKVTSMYITMRDIFAKLSLELGHTKHQRQGAPRRYEQRLMTEVRKDVLDSSIEGE